MLNEYLSLVNIILQASCNGLPEMLTKDILALLLFVEGEINAVNFTISWLFWEYGLMNICTRKVIPALRNIISSLQGDFISSSWIISRFDLSLSIRLYTLYPLSLVKDSSFQQCLHMCKTLAE